jgi:nuclear GTP-binding protein
MRGKKPEKKKQHKSLENRGKIRKTADFCALQRVKDRLTKQVHDRHKELRQPPPEARYAEISEAIAQSDIPDVPLPERGAAHEAYRTSYFAQFRKVVDSADVLLEVLDARDPLGCRSPKLESYILKRGKRVILILNKADLVPTEVSNRWLAHLRREFPAVLFKSTSNPTRAIEVPLHDGRWRSNDYFGVAELISLLNKYSGGTAIVAGVFGPPNSGKSSVINSLSRRAAAGVAATPGYTKAMQEIEVTSRIRILDCPGVVPSSGAEITPSMVLRNSIKVELLEDPVTPVAYIIDRVPKEQLVSAYDIGTFADADDFLTQLARKRGRVGKGGEPDLDGVARMVLTDWNRGRIKYFTIPPSGDDTVEGAAELVTAWGEVYPMTRTIEFAEKDFRDFQIRHVFEVVQKRKQSGATVEDESDDEEKVVPGVDLPPEEQQELNQLAEEYQAISFAGL